MDEASTAVLSAQILMLEVRLYVDAVKNAHPPRVQYLPDIARE